MLNIELNEGDYIEHSFNYIISFQSHVKTLGINTTIAKDGRPETKYKVEDLNRKSNYYYTKINEAIRHYNNICKID